MSDSVADGSLPHGAFDVVMLETALSYVADNFSGDQDGKLLRSLTSAGKPKRQKVLKGWWDGSCDLQLEEDTTPKPKIGFFFVADEDKDGTAEPFMVVKAGGTFAADDIFKCKVSIARCVNPVIYTTAGKTTAQLYAGISSTISVAITSITLAAYLPVDEVITSAVWSASGLPTGIVINSSTGALTGTPTVAAAYSVILKVTLANGRIGTRAFTWTIA